MRLKRKPERPPGISGASGLFGRTPWAREGRGRLTRLGQASVSQKESLVPGLTGPTISESTGDRQEPGGLVRVVQQCPADHPVVRPDGGRTVRATGGVLVEGTSAPDVFAAAV